MTKEEGLASLKTMKQITIFVFERILARTVYHPRVIYKQLTKGVRVVE